MPPMKELEQVWERPDTDMKEESDLLNQKEVLEEENNLYELDEEEKKSINKSISVLDSFGVSSGLSQISDVSLRRHKKCHGEVDFNKTRREHKRTSSDLSGLTRVNKENIRPTEGNMRMLQ